jgi:ligand-binding sensor domain-containing protein
MIMDRDANVWVGTDSLGLVRLNANGSSFLRDAEGVSHEAVTAVFEDREGNVWIGGADGIERLGDSAFVSYSKPEGLPTEGSNPVFVDSEDRLWFPPETGGLWWVKDGHPGRVMLDGLDRDLVYSLAGADGELWIGRQRGGLTRLSLRGGTFQTRTYTKANGLAHVQALSSDGNAVDLGKAVQLPGGPRRTTLSFAGLSLSAPDRVRYRYMLDGYDRE